MSPARVFKMAGEICLLFLYFALAAVGIDHAIHWNAFLPEALTKSALFVAALLPVLWRLEKKENLFGLLQKIAGMKAA